MVIEVSWPAVIMPGWVKNLTVDLLAGDGHLAPGGDVKQSLVGALGKDLATMGAAVRDCQPGRCAEAAPRYLATSGGPTGGAWAKRATELCPPA